MPNPRWTSTDSNLGIKSHLFWFGQSLLFSTDTAGSWLQLSITSGFGRLFDSALTLAFVGPGDAQLIRIPAGCASFLEALTDLPLVWGDSPEIGGRGDDLKDVYRVCYRT